MGKVSKGTLCSVDGCGREAVRSLSAASVEKAGLKIKGARRAYLCRQHYKEYKKATKKEKTLERWRYKGQLL
ncbi:MAG: hypothetical protein AYL33_004510 [Candidatus Bathyarchaeota archaeon B63]|nr:MAG: hypothetical protein AYL33_004510 [Candidatus Bathyarchaeota archaeon B63]